MDKTVHTQNTNYAKIGHSCAHAMLRNEKKKTTMKHINKNRWSDK